VPEIRQTLKLLVVADEEPPAGAAELVSANRPDAVITLGDLPADWLLGLSGTGVPLMGVHGNHDAEGDLEAAGIGDLHLGRRELGGWSFTGFEGSPRYSGGRFEYDQEEARELARRLPSADVLVSHSPPAGVNDDPADPVHSGFGGLREWVDEHRPLWILHGHTTPDPRTRTGRVGDTPVIWVRGARVVLLEDALSGTGGGGR
jgi:Icc-related predicted phosphoesterase